MPDIDSKFEIIQRYAEKHPRFDTEFVDSVRDQYEKRGSVSYLQEAALDNIIRAWRMQKARA